MDYRSAFADFEGVAYLNTAGQGPLPLVSARAAQAALEWKKLPHRMSDEIYFGLPDRIRELLARLLGGEPEEFAITSGASSGLGVVAANFDWHKGDEILIAKGEFPAHFSAFKPLEKSHGVQVKIVSAKNRFITAADFESAITPSTRLISASLVRFDDGSRLDAAKLAQTCRKSNITLVLDLAQCACAIPVNLRELGADFAVSSGYKWLLSPFGTGFFWARKEAMEKLRPGPFYWMAIEGARNFHALGLENAAPAAGARKWDAPETANFINLAAMQASLEWIEKTGVQAIAEHNARLVNQIIERLPRDRCLLGSPSAEKERGPYICIRTRNPEQVKPLFEKLASEQVVVSLREGALRVSPYLYNTERDISKLVSVLSV